MQLDIFFEPAPTPARLYTSLKSFQQQKLYTFLKSKSAIEGSANCEVPVELLKCNLSLDNVQLSGIKCNSRNCQVVPRIKGRPAPKLSIFEQQKTEKRHVLNPQSSNKQITKGKNKKKNTLASSQPQSCVCLLGAHCQLHDHKHSTVHSAHTTHCTHMHTTYYQMHNLKQMHPKHCTDCLLARLHTPPNAPLTAHTG